MVLDVELTSQHFRLQVAEVRAIQRHQDGSGDRVEVSRMETG
jgi:hypothetical protein